MTPTCAEAAKMLPAYVDGELAGVDRDVFERHLLGCDGCARTARLQARFKAAVRAHLPRPEVPDTLRARVGNALDGASAPGQGRWWSARRLVPVSAAAAAVAILVVGVQRPSEVFELVSGLTVRRPPLEVQDPDCARVAAWYQDKVDFPVQPRMPDGARCKGGRLVHVGPQPGAYMVYELPGGHTVSMLVYDPRGQTVEAPRRRRVDNRFVYFDEGRLGLTTAAFQDRGIGYAITSDLDEDALTKVVSASFR